ncbi:NAD-specific glutamate dehydrogenase [compost metagenome]
MRGNLLERLVSQRQVDDLAGVEHCVDHSAVRFRQGFLGGPRAHHQQAHVLRRQRLQIGLLDDPAQQALVEVIAAQRGIAAGGHHLEHAARELEHRDIEGAAAQVIDRVNAFGGVVEAIGNGCGSGLVQQAQHFQAGQARGVLGRLALGLVEVRRHGDDRADQVVAQRVFGALAQRGEDLGRDLDRALHAGRGLDLQHAGRVDEVVWAVLDIGDVAQAAAHEALDRDDGVLGVAHRFILGPVADMRGAVRQVAHDRRQQRAAAFVAQHFGNAAAYRGHQRVGGAEVDADGQAALVGRRRHAGFGNLEQCHGNSSLSCTAGETAMRAAWGRFSRRAPLCHGPGNRAGQSSSRSMASLVSCSIFSINISWRTAPPAASLSPASSSAPKAA